MRFWTILLTLAIIIFGYLFLRGNNNSGDQSILGSVAYRDISVELDVVGVLDASQSHMISSELRGAQGKIIYLIEDGTKVQKGDLLVKFDPIPFKKDVELLEAEVDSFKAAVQAASQALEFEKNQVEREVAHTDYLLNVARLELKKLLEGEGPLQVSQLEENQQNATIELQRHSRYLDDLLSLKKQGYENISEITATKEKVAVLRKKYETAASRYKTYVEHVLPSLEESGRAKAKNAELSLEQTKQGGIFKIGKAQARMNQIVSKLKAKQAALEQADTELKKTTIFAPFEGIVIHFAAFRDGEKRKPREGDKVFMGQPLVYLPDISSMIVKTKAREIDLYKLALGQQGLVRVDAYPDTLYKGKLTFIGALATAGDSKVGRDKYFQITFVLKESDKRLRPGMTCRTKIISQVKENVLSIPIQALFQEGDTSYCYVKKSLGTFTKKQISIGIHNDDLVEIVSGLQENDEVSLVKPR